MKALLLIASAALLFATPAAAQELITNGRFELGDFTGFTQFGNTGATDVALGEGTQGSFGAFFGPAVEPGGISQTIATVAGESFLISFDLSNDGGTPNFFDVDFGSSQLFTATDIGAFEFRTFSTTAIATDSTTTLSFAFRNDPRFFNLDNVSVIRATGAVPEPATWAMMLIGFGGMGVALRRRRSLATIAQVG